MLKSVGVMSCSQKVLCTYLFCSALYNIEIHSDIKRHIVNLLTEVESLDTAAHHLMYDLFIISVLYL